MNNLVRPLFMTTLRQIIIRRFTIIDEFTTQDCRDICIMDAYDNIVERFDK